MAVRIVGVDLPQNKRGEIALTYIFGIGRSSANKILAKAEIDKDKQSAGGKNEYCHSWKQRYPVWRQFPCSS